jgi:broad specificity phosphatase PhoE
VSLQLVYETHSITEDNERGIATGGLPGRLSARGRSLALELGERRRGDGLAAVYASDLGRAVETAELAFAASGVRVRLDRRLRECDYGRLNGCPVRDVERVRREHVDVPFPGGGQSYRQVVEATADFLDDLRHEHEGRRVLVVAHSANRWALQHLLDGAPLEQVVAAPFEWRPGWEWTLR